MERHEATVADYADVLTDGGNLPPVIVYFDGATHWLADGFHRFHAHNRIGALDIDADVRQGSLTDAKLCAYGANQAHGLRRTNEDKAKATDGMLREFPTWGDGNIARHIGVASMTVLRHRKLLEQAAILPNVRDSASASAPESRPRVVERGGQTYIQETANIGKRPSPAAAPDTPPKASGAHPPMAVPPSTGDAPANVQKTAAPAADDLPQPGENPYGPDDTINLLRELEAENKLLLASVKAYQATDRDAELDKYVRLHDNAQRQYWTAQTTVKRMESELQRLSDRMTRIGKLFNERDPAQRPALVEALYRQHYPATA